MTWLLVPFNSSLMKAYPTEREVHLVLEFMPFNLSQYMRLGCFVKLYFQAVLTCEKREEQRVCIARMLRTMNCYELLCFCFLCFLKKGQRRPAGSEASAERALRGFEASAALTKRGTRCVLGVASAK